jgi:hypothetical protein
MTQHVVLDTDVASRLSACCLADGLPLATMNTKDFSDFASHHGLALVNEAREER